MALPKVGIELVAEEAAAFAQAIAGVNASIQDMTNQMRSAADVANQFGRTTENSFNGIQSVGGGINAFAEMAIGALRRIGEIAIDALGKAARAIIDFGKQAISVAGDFEAGLKRFQAVAGKGVDTTKLKEFRDLFIQLGKELPVSTTEVETAATEMVSGGIEPATVAAGGLRTVIQFAAAANLDLATSAITAAKFIAGWTSTAATAAEKAAFLASSTDLITKAAAVSSTNVDQLRQGIFNVQGTAKALGVTFEDTAAVLGMLAGSYESSAQAGTGFNVFLSRLVPQTDKAAGVMQQYGLILKNGQNLFFDAAGNFLGLANAAEVLKDKLGGLSQKDTIDVLHKLFGNDAFKVGQLLMQEGADGLDNFKAKMQEANGVSEQAQIIQAGFNVELDNTKGSVEALQITIGSMLLPVLSDLLHNYIAPGINWLTDFAGGIASATDPMLTLAQQLGQINPDLSNIAFYLVEATRGGEGLSEWLAATPTDFQALVAVVQPVIDAFGKGGLSGAFAQIGTQVQAAIPGALTALGDLANQVGAWIAQQAPVWGGQLLAWGQAFVDWVTPYVQPALDALGAYANSVLVWVQGQAPAWGAQVQTWGRQFVDWIAPMAGAALGALGDMGMQVLVWIGTQAALIGAQMLTWGQQFIAWIPGATAEFLLAWPVMLDQFLGWIGEQAGVIAIQMRTWGTAFISWIVPQIPNIMNTLQTVNGELLKALAFIAGSVLAWAGETAVVLWKKINLDFPPAFIDWIITKALPGAGDALRQLGNMFVQWVVDNGPTLGTAFMNVGSSIVTGIVKGVENNASQLFNSLINLANQALQAAKDAIWSHSPSQRFADEVGEPIVMGIAQGIIDSAGHALNALDGLSDQMVQRLTDLGTRAGELMRKSVTDALSGGVSNARQTVSNVKALQDLVGPMGDMNKLFPKGQGLTDSGFESAFNGGTDLRKQAALDEVKRQQDINTYLADRARLQVIATAAQNELNAAQMAGAEISKSDAQLGANYYDLRSKQILELATLEKAMIQAKSDDERAAIQAQIDAVKQAQSAEQALFNQQISNSQYASDKQKTSMEKIIADAVEQSRIAQEAAAQAAAEAAAAAVAAAVAARRQAEIDANRQREADDARRHEIEAETAANAAADAEIGADQQAANDRARAGTRHDPGDQGTQANQDAARAQGRYDANADYAANAAAQAEADRQRAYDAANRAAGGGGGGSGGGGGGGYGGNRVSPVVSSSQIYNRAMNQTVTNNNTPNYYLSVNTPKTSQGIVYDYATMAAFGAGL